MAEQKMEVSIDGLSRLQSAARDFARAEIDRIVRVVVGELRSRPAEGVFGDVNARHLWDEFCWALQEGPFDDPAVFGDANFGSISDAFDGLVQACIEAEVEKLPKHTQTFLSALAFEEDANTDEEQCLGCIWIDGIVKVVTEAVNDRASRRNLALIGPHRAEAIGYEVQGAGFVWSVLDRSVVMDLVGTHADTLIDPNADLSPLADAMVEAFLTEARENEDSGIIIELVERFEGELRSLIKDQDVLPSLEKMRRILLESWDR